MKGQLKKIGNDWVVFPNWFYKDIIDQSQYIIHPETKDSQLEEREVEFEIVKYKKLNVALLDISFTKPGFIENRIQQMTQIKKKL